LWASRAVRVRGQRGAFIMRGGALSSIPGGALHYHEPGVWWVRALVAAARNDPAEVRRSAVRFAEAGARARGAAWDVSCGAAGLLLGCAQLVESLRDPVVLGPVRAAGEGLAAALDCAEDAVDAGRDSASLCYGRAGQGFAALTLYRVTGERRWLTAAHRLDADAVRAAANEEASAHQLFAGQLGVMLLAVELADPAGAAMPVYEAIGG
jgi:hypothetical protein